MGVLGRPRALETRFAMPLFDSCLLMPRFESRYLGSMELECDHRVWRHEHSTVGEGRGGAGQP